MLLTHPLVALRVVGHRDVVRADAFFVFELASSLKIRGDNERIPHSLALPLSVDEALDLDNLVLGDARRA